MIHIRSLQHTSFDDLFLAFQSAFEDYEMQLNKKELRRMLQRRAFVPDLSFGAYEKDRLVAFTFNGIGTYNGVKTAYDTGTGTLKEYRGQGLASRIFEHSLPFLQKAGIQNYLLEVLQHNKKAISVYDKLGFKVSREFNYFVQEQKNLTLKTKPLDHSYHIQSIGLDKEDSLAEFWDFNPSWQNDFASIHRSDDAFLMMGAFHHQTLVGYCILEPASGDITQIAVDRQHRRKGIASHLLSQILSLNEHASVKVINTEIRCTSITEFLKAKSLRPSGKQFEMIRSLAQ